MMSALGQVKAGLSGFKTSTTRPIQVEAKQIARLDFKLEVGAIEDSIEVVERAPVLQTESATVGEVSSGGTVESLPLKAPSTTGASARPRGTSRCPTLSG
jgi:hypothetical protein